MYALINYGYICLNNNNIKETEQINCIMYKLKDILENVFNTDSVRSREIYLLSLR